ncbi:hypothetical protein [Acidithiobacillus sp.]|uniref:hypothetical protein n=1 Tax=Acidithiobacillus sp. TaxID=1872118 RepID=UPI00262616E1|nr:hypothetical protein [Acidithiobacillus sp.]MDD5278695.1 hypothetical protein [Acidithiobacillus sp.]
MKMSQLLGSSTSELIYKDAAPQKGDKVILDGSAKIFINRKNLTVTTTSHGVTRQKFCSKEEFDISVANAKSLASAINASIH